MTAASESGYPVFSYPDYRDLRARTTALSGIAGFDGSAMVVEDSSDSAREWVSFVTENFFTVLGVRPAAGRFFTDPESENVVVLSYALWQRRFGGSPRVLGSTIELNGHASTVDRCRTTEIHWRDGNTRDGHSACRSSSPRGRRPFLDSTWSLGAVA